MNQTEGKPLFHSNVSPKRVMREQPKQPWTCGRCGVNNARYLSRCGCGQQRP